MDYSQPVLSSLYSDMLTALKDRDTNIIKMFDGTTDTNLPSGAKRWNATSNVFEKYDGSAWSPLSTKYMINVDSVDGCHVNDAGATVADLWSASKVTTQLGTKLDIASYTATDILSKIKTVDGAGSGLDADLLDGMTALSTNTVSSIVMRDSLGDFSARNVGVTNLNALGNVYGTVGSFGSNVISTSPNSGTTGTVVLKDAAGNPNAVYLQATNNAQNTQYSYIKFNADGSLTPSGTIHGNADTAYGLYVHTGRNNEANKVVRTDASGYLQTGYINSSNGDEKNNANCAYVWGTNGTDSYLRTYNTGALRVSYANNAGRAYPQRSDGGALNMNWSGQGGQPSWLWGGNDGVNMYVYDPSNFSVNYANSAGSVNQTLVAAGNYNPGNFSGDMWLWFNTGYDIGDTYNTAAPLSRYRLDLGIGEGGVYDYQYRIGIYHQMGVAAGYTSGGAWDGGYPEGGVVVQLYIHLLYGNGYVSGGINWRLYRV